jgi:hypothetical protein
MRGDINSATRSIPIAVAPATTAPAAALRRNFLRFMYHSYPVRGVISEDAKSAGFRMSISLTSGGETSGLNH